MCATTVRGISKTRGVGVKRPTSVRNGHVNMRSNGELAVANGHFTPLTVEIRYDMVCPYFTDNLIMVINQYVNNYRQFCLCFLILANSATTLLAAKIKNE